MKPANPKKMVEINHQTHNRENETKQKKTK